jgi:hypothetical protein
MPKSINSSLPVGLAAMPKKSFQLFFSGCTSKVVRSSNTLNKNKYSLGISERWTGSSLVDLQATACAMRCSYSLKFPSTMCINLMTEREKTTQRKRHPVSMTNKNKQFHSKTKFDRQGGARNNPSMGN